VACGWQRWQGSPRGDRWRFLLLALCIPLTIAGALAAHPAQEGMVVLGENLDAATVHAVLDELRARQVPYATTEGGQTILVPASLRAELIIELTHLGAWSEAPGPATAPERTGSTT
jgi:flagellar biosynthesis/type III secretory pathway M-ring protein FliF/YscJ